MNAFRARTQQTVRHWAALAAFGLAYLLAPSGAVAQPTISAGNICDWASGETIWEDLFLTNEAWRLVWKYPSSYQTTAPSCVRGATMPAYRGIWDAGTVSSCRCAAAPGPSRCTVTVSAERTCFDALSVGHFPDPTRPTSCPPSARLASQTLEASRYTIDSFKAAYAQTPWTDGDTPTASWSVARLVVPTQACLDEADTTFTTYASGQSEPVSFTASDWRTGIPYTVAGSLCPDLLSTTIGVNTVDDSHYSCNSPMEYWTAVRDFLQDPPAFWRHVTDGDDDDGAYYLGEYHWRPAYGETENTALVDFTNEVLLGLQPPIVALAQKADLAPGAQAQEPPLGGTAPSRVETAQLLADQAGERLRTTFDFVSSFLAVNNADVSAPNAIASATQAAELTLAPGQGVAASKRAVLLSRLRDLIETYRQVRTKQFDLRWRQLILEQADESCAIEEDVDSMVDPGFDRAFCDDTTFFCHCGTDEGKQNRLYAEMLSLVHENNSDMRKLALLLEPIVAAVKRVAPRADSSELADALLDLTDAVGQELNQRWGKMKSGRNAIGLRSGRTFPGQGDQLGAIAELQAELAANEADAREYTSSYFSSTMSSGSLLNQIQVAQSGVTANLTNMCADQATRAPAVEGCGMGHPVSNGARCSGLRCEELYELIDDTNARIKSEICEATVVLHEVNPGTSPRRHDDYVEARTVAVGLAAMPLDELNAFKSAFAAVVDNEGCPQLSAPSFLELGDYTGSVEQALGRVHSARTAVELAISDFASARERFSQTDAARAELDRVQGIVRARQDNQQLVAQALRCAVAIIGAAIATAVSYGSAAGTLVAAVLYCAVDVGTTDGQARTAADLEMAFQQYTATVEEIDGLAGLKSALLGFIQSVNALNTTIIDYETEKAGFVIEKARGQATLDASYDDLTNATRAYLVNQSTESLGLILRNSQFILDELHQRVQYEIGSRIPEGSIVTVNHVAYEIPLIAMQMDATAGAAAPWLGGTGWNENVFVAAELLTGVLDNFEDVYGTRTEQNQGDVYAIGEELSQISNSAMTGERKLIGDSAFYSPMNYVDIDSDGNGVLCQPGQLNLADWCNAAETTGANVCMPIGALSASDRLDLAYLDHMIRGAGVNPFECVRTPGGLRIRRRAAAAADGRYTYTELAGAGPLDVATAPFHREIVRGVSVAHYNRQTRLVKEILDGVLDRQQEAATTTDAQTVELYQLNRYPGSYLFAIDWTSSDPETLLHANNDNVPTANTTIAEQVVSMAVVPTGDSCSISVDSAFVFSGTATLGDRYFIGGTEEQERVAYAMSSVLVNQTTTLPSIGFTDIVTPADVANGLTSRAGYFEGLPLRPTTLLISIGGLANASGIVRGAGSGCHLYPTVTNDNPLTPEFDAKSRLRLALRYSYYSTAAGGGTDVEDIEGLTACTTDGAEVIGCAPGECVCEL